MLSTLRNRRLLFWSDEKCIKYFVIKHEKNIPVGDTDVDERIIIYAV
jgi:hypothetical protein